MSFELCSFVLSFYFLLLINEIVPLLPDLLEQPMRAWSALPPGGAGRTGVCLTVGVTGGWRRHPSRLGPGPVGQCPLPGMVARSAGGGSLCGESGPTATIRTDCDKRHNGEEGRRNKRCARENNKELWRVTGFGTVVLVLHGTGVERGSRCGAGFGGDVRRGLGPFIILMFRRGGS